MAVDVKAALLSYQQKPSLTEDDRAHIKRWLAVATDPVWQKIVDDIDANGELFPIVEGTVGFLISRALSNRREAGRL
jgi:hypothetical protein